MKKTVLMLAITLFSANLYANNSTMNDYKKIFISGCTEEGKQERLRDYCECTFKETTKNMTLLDVKKANMSQEPYYTNFLNTMKKEAKKCFKYIK